MPTRWYGMLHTTALDEETQFTEEVWQWAHAHGILWSYGVPHHPEGVGLMEW